MESRPLSEEGQGGPRQPVSFFREVECGKKKNGKNDEKQGNKMMPWRTLCTAKHLQHHRCCCFSPSKQCRTHPFESIDEKKRRNCVYAIGRDREETRNRCATQSFRYLRVFFFFSNAPEPGSTFRGYTARARARLKFVSTSLRSSVFALVTSKGGGVLASVENFGSLPPFLTRFVVADVDDEASARSYEK